MHSIRELFEKIALAHSVSPSVPGMVAQNHLGVLPQQVGVPVARGNPMTTSFSVADKNFKPVQSPTVPQQGAPKPQAPPSNQPPPAPQLSGTNAYRSAATQPIRTPSRKTAEYRRSTGIIDVNGEEYTNPEDLELLGKLGYDLDIEEYTGLEKSAEVLDIYSYIEKVAGVPKEVAKLIDKGEAFSGEYLKDMGYSVPEGYEVKGDLCFPVEKTEQSFQQTEKNEKQSGERPGLWANIHAKRKRGEKAAKPGDEDYPDKKQWDKLSKEGAADPSKTILVTGHSGAGKSTLAKALAEKLNIPLHRVDAQESWDNLRADLESRPDYERLALTPGSAENKQYIKDIRKIVGKSLKEMEGPAVLEGTQVTTLGPRQLKKYMANVLVGGDVEQSIAQRLQRMTDKAAKKGITLSPEDLDRKMLESRMVADSWSPGMEKFKKVPGVINYNHTEHEVEPLIEQLRALMNKQAAADPAQSILVTGHSGAGKTTLAQTIAEKLGLPLHSVDKHPEFKEYVTKDDHGRWQKSLTPGTDEHKFYTDLVHRANKHTIDNSPPASIIEGAQLGHMTPEELAKYRAHILVGGDPEQSIAQRIARSAKKKGVTFSPEEILEKQMKARAVVDFWEPGIEKFRKLPGVINYNHTEHQIEPLISQLRALMSKQAASAASQSKPVTEHSESITEKQAMTLSASKNILRNFKASGGKLRRVMGSSEYSPLENMIQITGKDRKDGFSPLAKFWHEYGHFLDKDKILEVHSQMPHPSAMTQEFKTKMPTVSLQLENTANTNALREMQRLGVPEALQQKYIPSASAGYNTYRTGTNLVAPLQDFIHTEGLTLPQNLDISLPDHMAAVQKFNQSAMPMMAPIGKYMSQTLEKISPEFDPFKMVGRPLSKNLRKNNPGFDKSFREYHGKFKEPLSLPYAGPPQANVKQGSGRCWEGYEPVPGKEAYSEDSCRPKTEKKKPNADKEK